MISAMIIDQLKLLMISPPKTLYIHIIIRLKIFQVGLKTKLFNFSSNKNLYFYIGFGKIKKIVRIAKIIVDKIDFCVIMIKRSILMWAFSSVG